MRILWSCGSDDFPFRASEGGQPEIESPVLTKLAALFGAEAYQTRLLHAEIRYVFHVFVADDAQLSKQLKQLVIRKAARRAIVVGVKILDHNDAAGSECPEHLFGILTDFDVAEENEVPFRL